MSITLFLYVTTKSIHTYNHRTQIQMNSHILHQVCSWLRLRVLQAALNLNTGHPSLSGLLNSAKPEI